MAEDMKNEHVKNLIEGYIDGAEMPAVDLSKAKEELRRTRSRRRGGIAAAIVAPALSVAALLLVAVVLSLQFLPAFFQRKDYAIADAAPMSETYASISQTMPRKAAAFAPFSLSDNAFAEYAVYTLEGSNVLLRADLSYHAQGAQATAVVWVDLTGGKRDPKEFKEYQELAKRGSFRAVTEYEGGEYVSRAYFTLADGSDCYMDVTASSEEILPILVRTLHGGR